MFNFPSTAKPIKMDAGLELVKEKRKGRERVAKRPFEPRSWKMASPRKNERQWVRWEENTALTDVSTAADYPAAAENGKRSTWAVSVRKREGSGRSRHSQV